MILLEKKTSVVWKDLEASPFLRTSMLGHYFKLDLSNLKYLKSEKLGVFKIFFAHV